MVDTTDPAIRKLYDSVRNDDDATNWGLFGYVTGKQKLQLVASGTGGYQEVLTKFADNEVMYAFVRYHWAERNRTKFVFITWVGPGVKALQKARIGHHKVSVADCFKGFHVELHAESVADLSESELLGKLSRAGGADYDGGGRTTGADFSTFKAGAKGTFKDAPSTASPTETKKVTPVAQVEPVQPKTVDSQPGDSADPQPVHHRHSEDEPVKAAPEPEVAHPADEPAPEHHHHNEEEAVQAAPEEEVAAPADEPAPEHQEEAVPAAQEESEWN